jgi:uncharacterized membrane protein YjgN (DUF898 family)
MALTIVTLGIYSAWAKVRKQRYFYGNTFLAGSSFGYHAEPLRILKGRLIAAVLVASYFVAIKTSVYAALATGGVFLLITPWLVVKSRTFTARVTSWRGLRFDFRQDFRGAYLIFLGGLVLAVLSLGILLPRLNRERYRFFVSRTAFGATAFECEPRVGKFYRTAFGAAGLGFLAAIALVIAIELISSVTGLSAAQSPAMERYMAIGTSVLNYAFLVPIVLGYTYARNHNEVFNHTTLGPHQLHADLHAGRLIGIYITNVIAIVFTLGLLTPWAQIRVARYRLGALGLEAHDSLETFAAAAAAQVPAAMGEELGSFFDLDFGF